MKKIFVLFLIGCSVLSFSQDASPVPQNAPVDAPVVGTPASTDANNNVNTTNPTVNPLANDSESGMSIDDIDVAEEQINRDLNNILKLGEKFKLIEKIQRDNRIYIYVEKETAVLNLKNNEGLFENSFSLEPNQVDPEISFPEEFPVDAAQSQPTPESEQDGRDTHQGETTQADTSKFIIESEHYIVFSSLSEKQARQYSDKLENLFKLYNSYFRFDEKQLEDKMRVYIFPSKSEYESYINLLTSDNFPKVGNFAYIHYPSIKTSFLMGYEDAQNESFNYHSSIQFIRSFIKNPPFWLRVGFSLYFQHIDYDKDGIIFQDNLDYLPYLKELIKTNASEFTLKEVRLSKKSYVTPANYKDFYVKSWGLVSFLLNTKDVYKRSLWDAMRYLKKDATEGQNIDDIERMVFSWLKEDDFNNDIKYYVTNNLRTYYSVIEDGREDYVKKDYENAINNFNLARDFSSSRKDYMPDYYLGLISYEFKEHKKAEDMLMVALDKASKGEDKKAVDLVYYALGVNAFENGDFFAAKEYLQKVKDLGSTKDNDNLKQLKQKITFLI